MPSRYDERVVGAGVVYAHTQSIPTILIVLVHGLNCRSINEYWSNIPVLMINGFFPPVDVYVWKYHTNINIFENARSILFRTRKLAEPSRVGKALLDDLHYLPSELERTEYDAVILLGHSQGGVVVIEAAFENIKSERLLPITKVCAASAPTRPNRFAQVHNLLGMGQNAQTRVLSSNNEFSALVRDKLPIIRKHCTTCYIESINDEVLEQDQDTTLFHHTLTIQCEHNWPSSVDQSTHPGFQRICQFVEMGE